jgi:drug/metabolite transporter (DMT)-like permease
MNPTKMIGLVLVIGGALALAYGGFTYTKESSDINIGPIELSVIQKETVNIPLWAGVGAVLAGGLLLAFGRR